MKNDQDQTGAPSDLDTLLGDAEAIRLRREKIGVLLREIDVIEHRREDRRVGELAAALLSALQAAPGENLFSAARRVRQELDVANQTIADVLRALKAGPHEGPRLAALRVIEERDRAREEMEVAIEKLQKASEDIAAQPRSLVFTTEAEECDQHGRPIDDTEEPVRVRRSM